MGICRLSFEAISARDGGDLLGLKRYLKNILILEHQSLKKKLKLIFVELMMKNVMSLKKLSKLIKGGDWKVKRSV